MDFSNFDFSNFRLGSDEEDTATEEPLVDFEFACEHKFECGSSWPYIATGAMTEKDRKAYKEWKAAQTGE